MAKTTSVKVRLAEPLRSQKNRQRVMDAFASGESSTVVKSGSGQFIITSRPKKGTTGNAPATKDVATRR